MTIDNKTYKTTGDKWLDQCAGSNDDEVVSLNTLRRREELITDKRMQVRGRHQVKVISWQRRNKQKSILSKELEN